MQGVVFPLCALWLCGSRINQRFPGLFSIRGRPNMTTCYSHQGVNMNINPAKFKAKCLKLIDEVAATHEPLVISKRGKPLVKLVPIENEVPASMFGYMKGTVTLHGDIVAPLDEAWSAETGEEAALYADLK